MRRLLADRKGRLYVAGQALSVFGDQALWLAAAIWVKTLTGSNTAAGLVFFFFGAPSLLAPVSGLLVDRVKRRPLLVATNLLLAGAALLLFLVHDRNQVWLIYVVMVLYGAAYGVLGSGESALLRLMLPEDLLGDANGILETLRQGVRLVGPLAGAGLFAWQGGGIVAAVDSATFVIAAVTILALRIYEPTPRPSEHRLLTEIAAGTRHLIRTTVLRQALLAGFLVVVPFGFSETVIFAVVGSGLHRPPTFLGVLSALQGVGAIAAGLTAAPLMRRTSEGGLVGLGVVVFAAATALLIPPWLPAILVGSLLLGACLPWIIVGLVTMLQRRTPLELQGRAYSAFDTLFGVPETLSIGVGAGLVAVVDYRVLLAVMTALSALSALYLLTRRAQWEPAPPSPVEAPSVTDAVQTIKLPIP